MRRQTAGKSSMRKFRQERRQSIRAQWRDLLLLCGLTVASAVWVAVADGSGQIIAAFLLGATMTVLFVGWTLGFDARLLRWRWGAAGEEWTAKELARLGPGWRVYHDIPDGTGNWDHIVVGRAGVFALDSKNLSQPATVDETGLHSGRLRYGGNVTRGSAMRMKEMIQERTGLSVWVQGVVAVWGQLPQGVVECEKVLYVPGSNLVETLHSRPHRLTDADRQSVVAALDGIVARG